MNLVSSLFLGSLFISHREVSTSAPSSIPRTMTLTPHSPEASESVSTWLPKASDNSINWKSALGRQGLWHLCFQEAEGVWTLTLCAGPPSMRHMVNAEQGSTTAQVLPGPCILTAILLWPQHVTSSVSSLHFGILKQNSRKELTVQDQAHAIHHGCWLQDPFLGRVHTQESRMIHAPHCPTKKETLEGGSQSCHSVQLIGSHNECGHSTQIFKIRSQSPIILFIFKHFY